MINERKDLLADEVDEVSALEDSEADEGLNAAEADVNDELSPSNYLSSNAVKHLSHEEQAVLIRKAQNGDMDARNRMIMTNMKLVAYIAGKYKGHGLEYEDMIQEGTFGLIRAIEMYDPDKGFAFSTYATWWIRQSIMRSAENTGMTIRLPVHMRQKLSTYRQMKARYLADKGRVPSASEVVQEMHVSAETVSSIFQYDKDLVSLNVGIGEDGDTSLMDMIKDNESPDVFSVIEEKENQDQIRSALDKCLSEREKKIIYARFGFDGKEPATLVEIGDELGITRERVRQVESVALRKIKYYFKRHKCDLGNV